MWQTMSTKENKEIIYHEYSWDMLSGQEILRENSPHPNEEFVARKHDKVWEGSPAKRTEMNKRTFDRSKFHSNTYAAWSTV